MNIQPIDRKTIRIITGINCEWTIAEDDSGGLIIKLKNWYQTTKPLSIRSVSHSNNQMVILLPDGIKP